MNGGDVRVAGRAVAVTDSGALARFAAAVGPPEPFLLFRVETAKRCARTWTARTLVVRTWRPGEGVRSTGAAERPGQPREHAGAADRGRAPGVAQGAGLAEPQRQVVLVRVADRAVQLEGGPRRRVRRLARRDLRGGDLGPGAMRQRAAPYSSGRANSSPISMSASWCLHRLEGADRRAPNWVRCLTYATVRSSSASPAPRACAAVARAAQSPARAAAAGDGRRPAASSSPPGRGRGEPAGGVEGGAHRAVPRRSASRSSSPRTATETASRAASASRAYGPPPAVASVAMACPEARRGSRRRRPAARLRQPSAAPPPRPSPPPGPAPRAGPTRRRHGQLHRQRPHPLVRLRHGEREHPRLGEPRPQRPPGRVVPAPPRPVPPPGCPPRRRASRPADVARTPAVRRSSRKRISGGPSAGRAAARR